MPALILPILVGLGFGAFLGAQADDAIDPIVSPTVNNLSLTTLAIYGAIGFAAFHAYKKITA